MQYKLETEQPLTEAACKAATGRTTKEWFGLLDEQDMLTQGRRKASWWLMEQGVKDAWWITSIAVEYERHKDKRHKDGLLEGYGICVTKTITAPLEAVYAAWTDSALLSKWFGPATKADPQDGGSYSNKDGDKGSYLRVRANKDLRFSWENPAFSSKSLLDVSFEDKGKGKTLVMANHSRIQTRAEADGLRAAWGAALDKLKAVLEA